MDNRYGSHALFVYINADEGVQRRYNLMAQEFKGFKADEILLLYRFMVVCSENKIGSNTTDKNLRKKYPALQQWETIISPTNDVCFKNESVIFDVNSPSSDDKRLYIAKRSYTTLVALIKALYDAISTDQIQKKGHDLVVSIKDKDDVIVNGSISWVKVKSFINFFVKFSA